MIAAMVLLVALATFCATLLGGALALRLGEKRHLILGFSAGAVIGVAFFDLLPAALKLGASTRSTSALLAFVALGFFVYLALDRFFFHREGRADAGSARGYAGAATLFLHSFLEGLGIGLGFAVAPAIGIAVGVAIIAHDFSDGINVVNVVLKHSGSPRMARTWLLADALGPLLGISTTFLIAPPASALGILLALIGGFFLYIGASDLIPESFRAHPHLLTTLLTLLGAGIIFMVTSVAG